MKSSEKITFCALMAAVAIVLGYIEALIPIPIAIPGIKLGIANLAVLLCLYKIDFKSAWFVMIIKVLVSNLLFGAPSMIIYSAAGGILSLFVMIILKKTEFNIINVSIGGGIFHNVGQIMAASLILKSLNVFYYLPVLILAGTATAFINGIVAKIIIKRIKR